MFEINSNLKVTTERLYRTTIYHIKDFYKNPDEIVQYIETHETIVHKENQQPSYNKIHFSDLRHIIKNKEINIDSPWYYFYSLGCAYCTKLEPIIDELIKEGHEILKLDISEPDNKKLGEELKAEYKKGCGTPWLVNADTGNHICGFKEKNDILEWLKGKDFPTPAPPKGVVPKVPFHGAPEKEMNELKKQYNKWKSENEHLPNLLPVDELLKRPRPKSDPPKYPTPNSTDEQLEKFGKEYDKWAKENNHIKTLQNSETIITRWKQQKEARENAIMQANNPSVSKDLEARFQRIEQKLDKLSKHFGVK